MKSPCKPSHRQSRSAGKSAAPPVIRNYLRIKFTGGCPFIEADGRQCTQRNEDTD